MARMCLRSAVCVCVCVCGSLYAINREIINKYISYDKFYGVTFCFCDSR